jgi:ABC-type transport system involved in cytochrome bd biosynthesis fused ATPase/permease subunit
VAILGKTGTGKSTVMRNMIIWDLKAGTSLSVLDPHGTLVQDILEHIPKERTNDVIFIDLKPPDKV